MHSQGTRATRELLQCHVEDVAAAKGPKGSTFGLELFGSGGISAGYVFAELYHNPEFFSCCQVSGGENLDLTDMSL